MSKEEFQKLWTSNFPDTVPISHLFKHDYSDRWVRIHNLAKSKRYPENDKEWVILLSRQNNIIKDLFGLDTPILLVTGEYNWGDQRKVHITDEEKVFKPYAFTLLDNINLFQLDPEQYDEVDIYRPAFAETVWQTNKHNKLLTEIAKDNIRAFMVSFDKNILVAPYDGGVDFVLADSQTRDSYREKYKEWLSDREDGL